ncbi:hypothetical protein [Pseudonocardia sp. HH130630-07]|uniref:hypothetical protein n=1 Tax=Pseudonocardia sp. HH130630-07 TaxID=1690815 RepID=UPI0008150048|nr:hypothetical protein [Pseudonocardia sp. HH130630-07]ANY07754.1 hypothetical protein AFB00_17275 [Pseudonocardia sp. HH130630-07]
MSDLRGEGVVFCETVSGSLTYRHYRSPGRYTSWSRQPVRWTVALTRRRLVVRRAQGPMVNVGWGDPRIATLTVGVDGADLLIAADVHEFHADSTGTVKTRSRVADPAAVVALVEQMRHHRR